MANKTQCEIAARCAVYYIFMLIINIVNNTNFLRVYNHKSWSWEFI